jgi:prolyl 4-hydroxylase
MSTQISPEWWDWIKISLDRGCSEESMIQVMMQNHFNQNEAKNYIGEVSTGLISKEEKFPNLKNTHTEYKYEKSFIPDENTIFLSDRIVKVAFRLNKPDIVLIDGFMSSKECEMLIEDSKNRLTPSTVANLQTGSRELHPGRTSEQMSYQIKETALIDTIEHRISQLLNLPIERGEGIQILHYQPGQEYRPHYDYFEESHSASSTFIGKSGQRICTFIMYLNDVEAGGETVFPEINLSVAPKRGSAIYFSYCNSLNQLDTQTIHGGAPVIQGEKWIATKWIRKNLISKQ